MSVTGTNCTNIICLGIYVCPTYYFPIRSGVQGRPAFVVAVDLKCSENSDYWVKRGTAMLLSLAN